MPETPLTLIWFIFHEGSGEVDLPRGLQPGETVCQDEQGEDGGDGGVLVCR